MITFGELPEADQAGLRSRLRSSPGWWCTRVMPSRLFVRR